MTVIKQRAIPLTRSRRGADFVKSLTKVVAQSADRAEIFDVVNRGAAPIVKAFTTLLTTRADLVQVRQLRAKATVESSRSSQSCAMAPEGALDVRRITSFGS